MDELGLRNVISPTQARKKWSNLLQKYMDIKGGYSTANHDWPYFQILDQIVPLMRKEKIEKLSPSGVDVRDLDGHESLPSPLTSPPDPETLSMPGIQAATPDNDKCKTEAVETGEPPRKRGRGRRAAQRARDRWWGAVEDSDLGSDSVGSGVRSEQPSQMPCKSALVDTLEPSQMELQTFGMLESCSTALAEIRDILKTHTERQESFMQSLQQTVTSQSSAVTELLNTVSSQNATLISLLTHITSKNSHPTLGMSPGDTFTEDKMRRTQTSHQEGQLLASQQNLITVLTHPPQQCESPLVETTELTDTINGL